MLLKQCSYLVTQDAQRRILEDVDVLIEHGSIAKVGKGLEASGEVIDCSGRIVMPGLINAHTHLAMGLLRGYSDDKELHDWLGDIWKKEEAMTDEEFYEGALAGCKESLRFGTTTVADMYHTIEPVARAAHEAGIRAWLFPDPCIAFKEVPLSIVETLTKHYDGSLLTFGYGPHSIYTSDEAQLKELRAAAKRKPVMIHLAETRKEQYECKQQRGELPAEYLSRIGFMNEATMLVHSVWLTKRELQLIADAGATVVHCPVSNMKLASGGVMPLKEMQERGITVGLGTDSVCSNNNLDMFEEMKVAALLHKQHYWDATVADAQTVLDMATVNGARCLGAADHIGSIEEGKRADIITLDPGIHCTPLEKERVVSHLVYSANGNDVRDVIVDGKRY